MMESETNLNRHNITKRHLDVLLLYMERYPRLALSTARGPEAHDQAKHMWEKIARTLNKIDSNVIKSGRNWKRYWAHRKFKARKRYATMRQCALQGTSCPPLLDTTDQRIVKIITNKDGRLLPTQSVCERKLLDTGGDTSSPGREGEGEEEEGLVDVSVQRDPLRVEAVNCYTAARETKKRTDNPKSVEKRDLSRGETESSTEELRRRILEFELQKQKELFELEKIQARERHRAEMEVLELKKQLLLEQL